jgi:hypothetical protein
MCHCEERFLLSLPLRVLSRGGNLDFSDRYELRDCFASIAKTAYKSLRAEKIRHTRESGCPAML